MSADPWQPRRGEVVLVAFPFLGSDGQAQVKPRPALVVSGDIIHSTTADVLIAAISSRPASRSLPTDYQIIWGTDESQAVGLKRTSWVKTSNLAAVPKAAVTRRLGQLSPAGLHAVDERLLLALGLASE